MRIKGFGAKFNYALGIGLFTSSFFKPELDLIRWFSGLFLIIFGSLFWDEI